MTSRRVRILAVAGLAVGAPVGAEFLAAYLSSTGKPLELLIGLVFFVPLYGGAALLIREFTVRTGRGWSARLLLAAAFGVSMVGVIDMSLFTVDRPDIAYWDALQQETKVVGISVSAALTWVAGHVVLSIGAPLAVAEALLGQRRRQPWLGRVGLVSWGVGLLLMAVLIHQAQRQDYGVAPTPAQFATAALVAVAFVGLAMSPLGRPLRMAERPVPALLWVGLGGALVVGVVDFAPYSWPGVVLVSAVTLGAIVALVRWAGSPRWGMPCAAAAGFGAIAARAAAGALSPVPEGVDPAAKVAQGIAGLLLVAGLGWWLWQRSWRGARLAAGARGD